MDYSLNEDQTALVSAVQSILQDYAELPQSERLAFSFFNSQLQTVLREAGFLQVGKEFGPLEAALITIEAARMLPVVEVSASTLVLPKMLAEPSVDDPVALITADNIARAQRNLTVAKTAIVDCGDDVVVLAIDPDNVEVVETVYGYPYGRFITPPDLDQGQRLGQQMVPVLRQWWRVALAAEFAGAAQSAVEFTVDYVKQRHVFGRPIGSFQAIHHRLAQCHQIVRGVYFLALKAAWSEQPLDADIAACYAQQHVQKLLFDLHQFNGAMGVTNEHSLHFWTYRLRALQAEVGGVYSSALGIADQLWGAAHS